MGIKIKIKKPKITIKKPKVTIAPPKVTVAPPKVTVAPPKVTVGGDVGKYGHVVIRGATRAIEDFATAPLDIAADVGSVINGKPLDEAFRDALRDYIRPIQSGVDAVAAAHGALYALAAQLANSIGGDDAADLLADFTRLATPLDASHLSALVASVDNFVASGNIDALNPLAILFAGEIGTARNRLLPLAHPIPAAVIKALPDALKARAGVCKAMTMAEVPGALNLPAWAIRHLRRASAICLIDVIVFERIPGAAGDEDLFYWSHELHHAQQYAGWGVQEFSRRYIRDVLSKKKVPEIEQDADLYACNFFKGATPRYIGSCPV